MRRCVVHLLRDGAVPRAESPPIWSVIVVIEQMRRGDEDNDVTVTAVFYIWHGTVYQVRAHWIGLLDGLREWPVRRLQT